MAAARPPRGTNDSGACFACKRGLRKCMILHETSMDFLECLGDRILWSLEVLWCVLSVPFTCRLRLLLSLRPRDLAVFVIEARRIVRAGLDPRVCLNRVLLLSPRRLLAVVMIVSSLGLTPIYVFHHLYPPCLPPSCYQLSTGRLYTGQKEGLNKNVDPRLRKQQPEILGSRRLRVWRDLLYRWFYGGAGEVSAQSSLF